MKARILLALTILGPFFYILFYVYGTATDLAFRDDMYLIKGGFIESYCKGVLTFADLWRPTASNRILGYNILQIANIKWFGMNSRFIVLLIPFLMLGAALFIYREYRKSLAPESSPEFIAATYFGLMVILFNVIQWEGLTFGYGLVFQSPMPFFIATFISLEALISTGAKKYWLLAVILSALAILVFGGQNSYSFAPALGATFLCYVLTRRNRLPAGFWIRVLLSCGFLAVFAFLYLYRIHYNDYHPGSSFRIIETVLPHPFKALQFIFAAFGASIVGVNAANAYFPFHVMVILGLAILFSYILAIALFFTSRMYERTYLPFYLIMQTFFYLGFMTLGRFGLGIDYGMASRYTCVSVYGLVALSWILFFYLSSQRDAKSGWHTLLYAPLLMIFSGLLLTAIVEWHIQPHRNAYFEKLQDIAIRVDTATPEELAKFENDPDLVRDSLRLLRKCRLNAYRPISGTMFDILGGMKGSPRPDDSNVNLRSSVAPDREDYSHLSGAYEREGNMRWASPEVRILLWRTNENLVSAEVTVPEGLMGFNGELGKNNPVVLRLFSKGCAEAALDIPKPGRYRIEAPVICAQKEAAGAPFEVLLTLNSHLDPIAIAPDVRSLAFRLHIVKLSGRL